MIKDIFTPVRCRLCLDKFNVFSDITLGDAWGYCDDKDGSSVIFARTREGLNTLLSAEKHGILSLKSIKPDDVFKKHAAERRRMDWACYTNTWEKMGRVKPNLSMDNKYHTSISGFRHYPYLRKLKWAIYFANLKSKEQVKAAVNKYVFMIKLLTLPLIKSVNKRLRQWL